MAAWAQVGEAGCEIQLLSPLHVAGGFCIVIFSQAAWKRSWVGRDPTQSKMVADRSVATIGIAVQAQLLTA